MHPPIRRGGHSPAVPAAGGAGRPAASVGPPRSGWLLEVGHALPHDSDAGHIGASRRLRRVPAASAGITDRTLGRLECRPPPTDGGDGRRRSGNVPGVIGQVTMPRRPMRTGAAPGCRPRPRPWAPASSAPSQRSSATSGHGCDRSGPHVLVAVPAGAGAWTLPGVPASGQVRGAPRPTGPVGALSGRAGAGVRSTCGLARHLLGSCGRRPSTRRPGRPAAHDRTQP